MGNGLKILIGDNSIRFGISFSRYLKRIGVDCICRRNSQQQIYEGIISENPDVVILQYSGDNVITEDFVEKISTDFPYTRIIVALYTASREKCQRLILKGAEKCIMMPCSMKFLYESICDTDSDHGRLELEQYVYSHYVGLGFPAHLTGFRYFCSGVSLVLINPEYMEDLTGLLYRKIAKIYNVTPESVERSIRNVAENICFRGLEPLLLGKSYYKCETPQRRLTNYELIAISADSFASSFRVFLFM